MQASRAGQHLGAETIASRAVTAWAYADRRIRCQPETCQDRPGPPRRNHAPLAAARMGNGPIAVLLQDTLHVFVQRGDGQIDGVISEDATWPSCGPG